MLCSVTGRSAPRNTLGSWNSLTSPIGDEEHAGPHAEVLARQPVDVGELDEDLLRVLDLDLGVEDELVVEAVAGIQDGAQVVELRRSVRRVVFVQHLAVAGDRDALLDSVRRGRGGRQPHRARFVHGHLDLRLAAPQPFDLLRQHLYPALKLLDVGLLPLDGRFRFRLPGFGLLRPGRRLNRSRGSGAASVLRRGGRRLRAGSHRQHQSCKTTDKQTRHRHRDTSSGAAPVLRALTPDA